MAAAWCLERFSLGVQQLFVCGRSARCGGRNTVCWDSLSACLYSGQRCECRCFSARGQRCARRTLLCSYCCSPSLRHVLDCGGSHWRSSGAAFLLSWNSVGRGDVCVGTFGALSRCWLHFGTCFPASADDGTHEPWYFACCCGRDHNGLYNTGERTADAFYWTPLCPSCCFLLGR